MALFLNEIEVSQPKLPFGLLSIPVHLMRRRGPAEAGPPFSRWGLEMETELSCQRTRCHVVRPAEGRNEIVECVLVRHIDGSQCKTPFVTFSFEQVVVAHRYIKEVTRRDSRRIMIVVFCSGCRYLYERRPVL